MSEKIICGYCGQKMTAARVCRNLSCSSNRHVGQCSAMSLGYGLQPATEKQIEYINSLANKLEKISGIDQERIPHCKHCASVMIENLQAGIRYYSRKK